jgi:ADP-ribose pyrophosphatase YjhB (NUDIX family)
MKTVNSVEMISNDICFQTNDKRRFRLRAAAIIIENGAVLFATNDAEDYYYTIGGGVELGETAEEAVRREVKEETGVDYQIERLAFIQENFFKRDDGELKDLSCHEVTFYFLMKSRGTRQLDSHSKPANNTTEEKMVWLPLDKLGEYDAYPLFFREKLKNLPPYPEYIVTSR